MLKDYPSAGTRQFVTDVSLLKEKQYLYPTTNDDAGRNTILVQAGSDKAYAGNSNYSLRANAEDVADAELFFRGTGGNITQIRFPRGVNYGHSFIEIWYR